MAKIIITGIFVIAAAVVWRMQTIRMDSARQEIEQLRETLEPKEPRSSGRVLPTPTTNPPANTRTPAEENPSLATKETQAEYESDLLKVKQLEERLELAPPSDRKTSALLKNHVRAERKANDNLLEAASGILNGLGNYGELVKNLHACGTPAFRDLELGIAQHLNPAQNETFQTYLTEQKQNLLQLLADQEFDAWNRHLNFDAGEKQEAAYRIFYEQWNSRLQSPLPDDFSSTDLKERLQIEREDTLKRFTGVISPEDQITLEQTLDAGHRLLLGRQEATE